MKTVNVTELQGHLDAYLTYAKAGEEVIISEQNLPVAKLIRFSEVEQVPVSPSEKQIPLTEEEMAEHERYLVATGQMTLPKKEMNWEDFDLLPSAEVTDPVAVKKLLEDSSEWR